MLNALHVQALAAKKDGGALSRMETTVLYRYAVHSANPDDSKLGLLTVELSVRTKYFVAAQNKTCVNNVN